MTLTDLVRSSRTVLKDRMRAALTLLGIIIGSGSIVLLAGLLAGGETALMSANQDAYDADLIKVETADAPGKDRYRPRRELSLADAEALGETRSLGGARVSSEATRHVEARSGGRKKPVTLVTATPEAPALYRIAVARGRFIDQQDLDSRSRVCVVGHEVWEVLLDSQTSLSDIRVEAGGESWAVVGVLEERPIIGSTDSTSIWDRKIVVPETTFDAVMSPDAQRERIYVRRSPGAATPLAALRDLITKTVLRRHNNVKNFDLEDPDSHAQEELIMDIIQLLLLGAGMVALFVGGINIMNIMLVTVSERTREIGVRRAVGASPRAILGQFLFEAATISLLGGLVGVSSGAGLSYLAALGLRSALGHWTFYLEPWSVGLGIGLSLTAGVAFGFYPAWRAARLDPIEALRGE